jgi:glycosyltransferase involved in cell wall biosynthesis
MSASEAMAHGIPVVANRTPGLWENLQGVAVWADRDQPEAWVEAINLITKSWADHSHASRERALKQQATFDLEVEQWCDVLEKLC